MTTHRFASSPSSSSPRGTTVSLAARRAALGLLLLALLAGRALAAQQSPPEEGGIRYKVVFTGTQDKELLGLLHSISETATKSDKPPSSLFLLRGRARADLKRLTDAMASRGYFASTAEFAIDENQTPVLVTFTVHPGEVFKLARVDVELAEGSPPVDFPLPEPADLGLALNGPAVSKAIVDGQARLAAYFKNRGRPFTAVPQRRAVADYQAHSLVVAYVVTPGPRAVFGPAVFTGLTNVRQGLVESLVPWKEGEEYSQEKVDLLRKRLMDLGLFAKVSVAPRPDLEEGKAVVEAALTERKHRTFKGGLTYNTDDGPGAKVFWEHRNLFGGGERLRVRVEGSQVTKLLEVKFENPFFLHEKQKLLAGFAAADQNTKAFHGRYVMGEAKITRQLSEHVTGEAGLGWRSSLVYDDAANPGTTGTRYNLGTIPLGLSADTRNDPLDATRGWLFSLGLTPHVDMNGGNLNFLKASLSGAHYLTLLEKPSVILALRASAGSISGVSESKLIPPDVRFYAGGSGSIRGYAYQTAGPLRGSKPLGGLSEFDFTAELRLRLTELFGLVLFLDGGNAYETVYPEPSKGILAGAGAGLRVFTPIGPFRVDVATPLYRRKKVDDIFQLYISVGQAF